MHPECFALLDDASAGPARSRLYTSHVATLPCNDIAEWPALLDQMQQALRRGQYAVLLCAYELGAHLQGLAPRPGATHDLAQILLFEQCRHLSAEAVALWLAERTVPGDAVAGIGNVHANVDEPGFALALARIHAYLEAGDSYQVNYTYRLHFDAFGSLFALYARLRERQPVPYGALIGMADGSAMLSLSPELFVRHAHGMLTAQPMKGTAPAGYPEEDGQRAAVLAADPKNRAENLMIVDLLRSDIGRIAVTGSVQVPALFDVQRYGDVLQMTSTVQARLRADATLAEIFLALFPCGSITGAPKRRTMEIIHELEPVSRGIYTGAIGWFDAPAQDRNVGDFCLSVPIRTLALQAPADGVRKGQMGVGAGIVFDSDTNEEFAECRLKATFLTGMRHDFDLFETMHASRAEGVRHLDRHMQRLFASARYFGFACDAMGIRQLVAQTCAGFLEAGAHRLRLNLNHAGVCSVQSAPLPALTEPVALRLAGLPTRSDDLFLRHKTTLRARYDAGWRQAEAHGAFDTVFFNERGELTEGGRSNVFVKQDGRWITPPLSSGILPGVMRGVVLDDPAWAAGEKIVTLEDLRKAEQIMVCSALRGTMLASIE